METKSHVHIHKNPKLWFTNQPLILLKLLALYLKAGVSHACERHMMGLLTF